MSETQIIEPDYFELSLTRFTPEPMTRTVRIKSVAELDEQLRSVADEELLDIGVSCVAEESDWGSFWLLVSNDRAYIHLMEGACLTGSHTPPGQGDVERVRFQDDGGNWHEVALADTVSREVGLHALRYWLSRGEKLPELHWRRT